jgi:glycosyltransferase involved in cell wall biosynthesis
MTEQYAAHDVFLMPSLTEGSPLSLLEAMAAGVPVVAARAGGIPDVVTHGVDGLLFDVMDAPAGAAEVCSLLQDPELAGRLGQAGQRRVSALTWRAAAEAVDAAARRVLEQDPGRAAASRRNP